MKNKNNFIIEIIISLALLILAGLLFNPFAWFMPSPTVMMIIVGLVVAFGFFAAFVLREKPRDEREMLHRMVSGRIAFLAGVLVLVIGIIVEGLQHEVDAWLIATLLVMIFTKIITSIYNNLTK